MFGKHPRLNPSASRKQLLLAESELNRAHLVEDLVALKVEGCALTDRAQSISSIVASSAALVTGLLARQRGRPGPAGAKPAWWQTMLKGAGFISTLWLASRPQAHERENK